MLKYFARIMIAVSLFAIGLPVIDGLNSSASAEVSQPPKPVKPSFRIIEGKTAVKPQKPEPPQRSDAARTWEIISSTRDIGVLNRFVAQFPGTPLAKLALDRRDKLIRGAVEVKTDKGEPPARNVKINERPDLARSIQFELFRLGCNPGPSDGKWGRKTTQAAERFSKFSRVVVETGYPNAALLAGVKAAEGKVCPVQCGAKFDQVGNQCMAKTCPAGQRLSSAGRCYTPKVAKTCGPGQRLSSKGRCYTPKVAKTCRRGERLSSRGICFKPKPLKKKVATPRKPVKPKVNRCSWCTTRSGTEVYACGSRLTSMRASGNCN